VSTLADLKPGMIGFGPIHGGAGALVNAGQLLLGEGFRVGRLDIRHVFVVTKAFIEAEMDAHTIAGAFDVPIDMVAPRGPWCVEAMPGGAREVTISDRWTPEYAYVQLPEDYPGQAADAAAIARAMIGTPYSFASYAALAAWRFGVKTPRLEAWIGRTRKGIMPPGLPCEAICSVLADQAWALTGKQVMPEGTPHQCVTPGALAGHLLEADGVEWIWPGR
jgi:hypothetical protein